MGARFGGGWSGGDRVGTGDDGCFAFKGGDGFGGYFESMANYGWITRGGRDFGRRGFGDFGEVRAPRGHVESIYTYVELSGSMPRAGCIRTKNA